MKMNYTQTQINKIKCAFIVRKINFARKSGKYVIAGELYEAEFSEFSWPHDEVFRDDPTLEFFSSPANVDKYWARELENLKEMEAHYGMLENPEEEIMLAWENRGKSWGVNL